MGGLKVIARANPLSYEVDALRALMLTGGVSRFGLDVDCLVLIGVSLLMTAIATNLYPRLTM